jgi:hypothetical protein
MTSDHTSGHRICIPDRIWNETAARVGEYGMSDLIAALLQLDNMKRRRMPAEQGAYQEALERYLRQTTHSRHSSTRPASANEAM